MIREFAVAPEVVASWGNRSDFRFFYDAFGLGTGRLISKYPGKWAKRVLAATSSANDLDRARVEELVKRFRECMIERIDAKYDGNRTWFENALEEHARLAFHAIIAQGGCEAGDVVLSPEDLGPAAQKFEVHRDAAVPRQPADLCATLVPLARCAETVILVDPYFNPTQKSYRDMLAELFQQFASQRTRPLARLEIHASDQSRLGTTSFYEQECRRFLPRLLPVGANFRVVRWQQRSMGEQVHERYLLTELGGYGLSAGYDKGTPGETVNVHLLGRQVYELRWQQYASDTPAFDLYQEILL